MLLLALHGGVCTRSHICARIYATVVAAHNSGLSLIFWCFHPPMRGTWLLRCFPALQAYRMCYLHSASSAFTMSPANYIINHDFKFVYFEIPKVASTAIRTLLSKVSGGTRRLERNIVDVMVTP
jgi:hypothetical protein